MNRPDERTDVIVSGHLCLDLIPRMAHVPLDALATPGRLFEVGPLDIGTGGVVSNTGLALHRLGVSVRLMATVGDDLLGQLIIACLRDHDPALSALITVRPGQPSSYTVVLSPQKVDRIFLHCTGTNADFGADDIDPALLAGARLFHLGYPPILPRLIANQGQELVSVYRRAKETGVVTSLDLTLPDPDGPSGQADWPTILARTLPHVDIFVPSINEILFMLRRADYDAWRGDVLPHLTADYLGSLADELLAMGVCVAGFKLGTLGLYLRTASAACLGRLARLPLNAADWAEVQVWTPAFQADVVGTTGAGDAAYAGLLAAMLRGMAPQEAARWACAVGACCVEASDATSGIRTWQETQARLEAGWPTLVNRLPGL